jgi:hypothetical protein
MVYRGRVEHGVVVLDESVSFPDGTEVSIRALRPKSKNNGKPVRKPGVGQALLRLAGKAVGLPADASRNVDHCLYGHRNYP